MSCSDSAVNAPDIFLSYNREDLAIARIYAEGLAAAGFTVWWDATLKSGEAYDEVTETALRTARAVLVLWSPRSVQSRWVRAEATIGQRNGTLVPVTIEQCERPVMFELTQTADLTAWHGEPHHPAWLALIEDLRRGSRRDRLESVPLVLAPAAASTPLLAVLPFDNLVGDQEMTYFSDGVSEEILHGIARAKGLKVIGKTSSFQFRGPDKTTRRIVSELKATHMLDGSVRRVGNNVRISAQLIETASQTTLWSDRYDRPLTDIFALQDEIAAAIADALDAHFTPKVSPMSIDGRAYDSYLKARTIYTQDMTSSDQARCIALLTDTVTRAPDFAAAWGLLALFRGLSNPCGSIAPGHDRDAGTTVEDADTIAAATAATRALALDPDCAPALMAQALLQPGFGNFRERRRLAELAFRLAPGDSIVAAFHAVVLATTGRVNDACKVLDEIVVREPLSPSYAARRAYFHRSAGHSNAAEMARTTAEAFPDSPVSRLVLGYITAYDGDMEGAAAIAAANSELRSLANLVEFLGSAQTMDPSGRTRFVRDTLAATRPFAFIVQIAVAAHVGEADVAFAELFDAIDHGRPFAYDANDEGRGVARANICGALFGLHSEALRRDPRFATLCVRLGLYDGWRETGEWPDCAEQVALYYDFRAACIAAAASRAA